MSAVNAIERIAASGKRTRGLIRAAGIASLLVDFSTTEQGPLPDDGGRTP